MKLEDHIIKHLSALIKVALYVNEKTILNWI